MGLFGSLFTGVSALFAQSQNTAIISNNIANVNTTGFKRSSAAFQSLVTTESHNSSYSPGTVSTNRIQDVKLQGSTQQTSSSTDASISGNGFFPVKRSTDDGQEFLYTRAGQFAEDASGLLTNASKFVLYGWPLDTNGALPASEGDLSSLVPVNVAFLGGLTRPTTLAKLSLNLDSDTSDINAGSLSGGGAAFGTTNFTGYPIPSSTPADFSRGLTIYDQLGAPQTIQLEYRKVPGIEASALSETTTALTRSTVLTSLPGINPLGGDTFTVAVTGTAAQTYIIGAAAGAGQIRVDTVGDLMDQLNLSYGGGAEVNATLTANGQLQIKAQTATDSITLADTTGTPLFGANALNFPQTGPSPQVYAPFVINGGAPQSATNPYGKTVLSNNQGDFPVLANTVTPNTAGWWELKVLKPDGTPITQGLINFNGDGSLNAATDSNGKKEITLSNVDWNNGSSLQSLNIDIGSYSQFAGNFNVISSTQNGAALGLRTGVEITRDGIVVAQFSNGASADLYKVPLVTFANPDGLNEVSGTAYSKDDASGEENLREAGQGGAGFVEPSTLESSNVDLADEFAKLIVAQRAFGAGTRVITTVDQMTQDLLNLGR